MPKTEYPEGSAYQLRHFKESIMEYKENPFTFENLAWAARECMKGVGWKNGTARWRMNLLANCRKLERELADGTYRMGRPNSFRITSPKPRVVSALMFRDRVVHKVLCHQGGLIRDMFRNSYIDNCACQTGKGTTFAIDRLKRHLMEHHRLYGCDGYVVEIDVRKFFDSIPHGKLIDFVYGKVRNPMTRRMVADIIRSYNGEVGIGLGSEISQVLANSYLTALDYVMKEKLGIKHGVRYADNGVYLIPPIVNGMTQEGETVDVSGREFAKAVYNGARYALKSLGLEINPKSSVHPLSQGIHFLGFRWTVEKSGRIRRNVLRKSTVRIRRRLKRLVDKHRDGKLSCKQVMASFESWAAYAGNSSSDYSIKKIKDELMEALRK